MKRTIRLRENEFKRIIAESVRKILNEGRYYNPRTYQREEEYEITKDEKMKIISILQNNPIEEMWKPQDLGFCKVQRINAGDKDGGRCSILSKNQDGSFNTCSDSGNGQIIIEIGRKPNTPWFEDDGYTYLCWK